MGITYISGTVTGPNGQRTLEFLVDSGATYTLLPCDVWQDIGLSPKRSVTFSLVDGSPQSLPATRPVPVYAVHIDGADVIVRTQ